jgi:hypothetical protein
MLRTLFSMCASSIAPPGAISPTRPPRLRRGGLTSDRGDAAHDGEGRLAAARSAAAPAPKRRRVGSTMARA